MSTSAIDREGAADGTRFTTFALIGAALIAFLFAGAMLFDTYSTWNRPAAAPPPPAASVRLPAPARFDDRLLAEILEQQQLTRAELGEVSQAVAGRADAARCPAPAAAPPAAAQCPTPAAPVDAAGADRHLRQAQEQLGELRPIVEDYISAEKNPQIRPRFDAISSSLAAARRAIRSGGGARRPAAAALPAASAPAEPPLLLLTAATAAAPKEPRGGPSADQLAWTKFYMMLGMFVILGIAFVGAVVAILITKDAATGAFARDTVKMLLGFFIGMVSAFMTAPT